MKKMSKNKMISLLLASAMGFMLLTGCAERQETTEPETTPDINTSVEEATPTDPEQPNEPAKGTQGSASHMEEANINLGNGLFITDIGGYTGVYMEDGSDELVSGVLMLVVNNTGDSAVQYAEIELSVGDQVGLFTLSTLPGGESVVLLEKNRLIFDDTADYSTAVMKNVVMFTEPLSLMEDKLKLQVLDGAINVTNTSEKNISGDIVIYYKNSAADLYYGGITYRARIEGGLAAGEIRQVMGNHLSQTGTTIMFVTIG